MPDELISGLANWMYPEAFMAIVCQGCRDVATFDTVTLTGEAAALLVKRGWTLRDGKPLCPECSKKGANDAP